MKLIIIIFSMMFLLTSCTTFYNKATGRHEVMFISNESESVIGDNVNAEITETMEISQNASYIDRVNKVGGKLASSIDTRGIEYKFFVVEDERMNAFTIPGGYIYVTTGLLDNIKSDDELAAVIAHEMGHAEARHAVKRMEGAMGYSALMSLAYSMDQREEKDKQYWKYLKTGSDVVFNLITLGYSREDEYAADRLAVKYAYQAGYDPGAAITMFEKLKVEDAQNNKDWTYYLRSHPYIDERIVRVNDQITSGEYKSI